jgi:hypothetical protein
MSCYHRVELLEILHLCLIGRVMVVSGVLIRNWTFDVLKYAGLENERVCLIIVFHFRQNH